METGSSFTEELDTDHTEQVTVQPQVGFNGNITLIEDLHV